MAFRKPGQKRLGAKFLVYGKKGSGKSLFMLSFPKIAVIDSEAGVTFYEDSDYGKNIVLVSNTQSYHEMEDDIEAIKEDHEKLGIQTFAIDSVTKIKENLEEIVMTIDEKKARQKGQDVEDTNISVRSRGRIKFTNKRLQNVKIDLSTLGVNIVDIAQEKEVKQKVGENWVTVSYEPDMQRGSEHDYDVVIRAYTEVDSDGVTHFYGKIEKDRLLVFKVGDIVENISYDLWKDAVERNSGKEKLHTSFSEDVQSDMEEYEEESNQYEHQTWKERFKNLSLAPDIMKEVASKLKTIGVKNLDKVTPEQEPLVQSVYDYYKGKK